MQFAQNLSKKEAVSFSLYLFWSTAKIRTFKDEVVM